MKIRDYTGDQSNFMQIKTTTITPELCECRRLYKDRRDKDGKMICSACYTGLSVEDLKKLWGAPIKEKEND